MIQIFNRFSGSLIFECDADSMKVAMRLAIEARADLSGANLSGADLSCADLRRANLSDANLRRADLRRANLRRANLSGANLSCADLSGADLSDANLSGANLSGANLSCADLRRANLRRANLRRANLSGANLSDANLSDADANEATAMYWPVCPPEGAVIGWKKCQNGVIVKLLIPAAAKRSSATTRKCRAEFAQVLEVIGAEEGTSSCDAAIKYRTGETVTPDSFDENRWAECSSGIHFFITREEAEAWN